MDRAELERLFNTYADDVFRLAYSYLGSRPEAEDVCQSVFLKLAEGKDPADREVHAAVMSLPPISRAVVHLYYFEGYDQREIGKILNISRTAVQTRMARAREMLRKELSDDEGTLPARNGAGGAH